MVQLLFQDSSKKGSINSAMIGAIFTGNTSSSEMQHPASLGADWETLLSTGLGQHQFQSESFLQQLRAVLLALWSEDGQGGGWTGGFAIALMSVICAFSLTQPSQLQWADIPHSIVLLLRKQNWLYLAPGIFCVGFFRGEFANQMD